MAGEGMFLDRLQATIRRYGLLERGQAVLVAVSGGVDSMVLLHGLLAIRDGWGLRLALGHLHHGLRGAEADRDAAFVEEAARGLGLPVTVGRAEIVRRGGQSLQEAAREARYAFLGRVAREQGLGRIALGHTGDDVAETFLMNLLRGAGARGLGSVPPAREGGIIRPLIDLGREDVEAFARERGIAYVADSSNAAERYLRNRVRHRLIPLLAKEFNPQIARALGRTALLLREEDAYLDVLAGEALSGMADAEGSGRLRIGRSALLALPRALQRRAIRAALRRVSGHLRGLGARHVEAALALLRGPCRTGELHLPGGTTLWLQGDDVRLGPAGCPRPLGAPGAALLPLAPGARAVVGGAQFSVEFVPREGWAPPPDPVGMADLDADRVAGPLTIRMWLPGDRFQPLGMSGTKKLQDLFVDAKVPRPAREAAMVVLSAGSIVWVVGHRIDHRFRVREATRRVLRLSASPLGEPRAR